MELLNYSLTATVAFLGLFVGAALAFIAHEELKPGKKYFVWMEKIILLLLLIFLLNYYGIAIIFRVIIYLLLVATLLFKEINNRYIYPVLAMIFFLSAASESLLFKQATLIFLYGLPAGSLFVNVKNRKIAVARKLLINYGAFLIIALLLFLI
jgi:hypothetical protein